MHVYLMKKNSFHQNVRTFILASSPSPLFILFLHFFQTLLFNHPFQERVTLQKKLVANSFTLTSEGILDMNHDVEFDLFQAHSAKLISESLGAQINPDLSWTSSFNTPSSLTPTVILRMYEYSYACLFSSEEFIVYN